MAERHHGRARWLARHAAALLAVGVIVILSTFVFAPHGSEPSLAKRAMSSLQRRGLFVENIFDFGPKPGGAALPGAVPAAGSQSVQQIGQAMANDFMNQFSGMMNAATQSSQGISGLVGALGSGVGSGAAQGLGNGADSIKAILKNPAPTPPQAETNGLNGIAFALGDGVAGGLTSAINVSAIAGLITPQALQQLAGGLGTGLGSGATTGLNINKVTGSATTTTQPQGIFGTVANALGDGLSNSFLGNVDLNKITSALDVEQLMTQAGAIAGGVGQGLGIGAAQGLAKSTNNPTVANVPSATNGTLLTRAIALRRRQAQTSGTPSISDIAQNFSQGLSFNFLANTDLSKVTPMISSAALLKAVGQAAPGVGSGLGSGAADGLKKMLGGAQAAQNQATVTSSTGGLMDFTSSFKSKRQAAAATGNNSVSSIANQFSFNLASNFIGDTNLSALASTAGMTDIGQTLASAAPGLGRGLGGGAAQGLGLIKQAIAIDTSQGNTSASFIAESFSQPLAFNFLNGADLSALTQSFTSSSMMSQLANINITSAAASLAGGLVSGAGSTLFPDIAQAPADAATQNNTVNNVARGFGTGLGGEGVKVVLSILGNKGTQPEPATTPANPSSSNTTLTVPKHRRSTFAGRYLPHVEKRQEATATTAPSAQQIATTLLDNVNFTEVNNLVQNGANDLQCEGVGAIFQATDALKKSGTLNLNNLTSPANTNLMLPNVTLNITQSGNLFQINPAQQTLIINGLTQPRLTILLVIHIGAIIIGIYTLLPNIIILALLPKLFAILGVPHSILRSQPTRLLLSKKMQHVLHALVFSLSMVSLVFGVLANGSASHFHTPHQIIGFIMMGMIFANTFFHVYQTVTAVPESIKPPTEKTALTRGPSTPISSEDKRTKILNNIQNGLSNALLGLSQLQLLFGFTDLNAITFCLTSTVSLPQAITFGAGLATTGGLAVGAVTIQMLIDYWERKRAKVARDNSEAGETLIDVAVPSAIGELPQTKMAPSKPKQSIEQKSGWYNN